MFGMGRSAVAVANTILSILLKAPGAMNSHAMCPANGPLTICAKQLCPAKWPPSNCATLSHCAYQCNTEMRGRRSWEISSNLTFAIYHVGRTLPHIMCNVVC